MILIIILGEFVITLVDALPSLEFHFLLSGSGGLYPLLLHCLARKHLGILLPQYSQQSSQTRTSSKFCQMALAFA